MGEDAVEQLKFGATILRDRISELIAENGLEGARVEWQAEGGWESLPTSAILLVSGRGEPLRLAFSREAIIDYPGGIQTETTESVIFLLMALLRKQR